MDYKEADYMLTQLMPDLRVNVKIARKCYVMAKMTTDDEPRKIDKYNKMLFVEFLEMLCRVAFEHFDDYCYSDWSFMKKLENVLDNVLNIRAIERKEVVENTLVDSDADVSDCDY